jgi:hypothetical protein
MLIAQMVRATEEHMDLQRFAKLMTPGGTGGEERRKSRVVGPMTRAAQGSPFLSTRQLSRRPEALGSREETFSLVGPASDHFSLSSSSLAPWCH